MKTKSKTTSSSSSSSSKSVVEQIANLVHVHNAICKVKDKLARGKQSSASIAEAVQKDKRVEPTPLETTLKANDAAWLSSFLDQHAQSDAELWRCAQSLAKKDGSEEMILVLLCAICDPKAFDASPLLVDAARHNMLDVARLILSKFSFDINYQHEFYGSAFCTAVRQGSQDIAWMLLEQPGVDIHIKNANKRNAAFFAAMNEDRLMLEKLLEMGADTLDADAEDTIAEERTTSDLATKIRDSQDLGIDKLGL